jgi:acetylornithine deacetylase/succinyl-diaminopimelate desuccinylase-like protein
LVYAEWTVPGATRTLVLYAHYDGQPVNPAEWATPPFEPVLRTAPHDRGGRIIPFDAPQATNDENRLYGRGAGDDKAGVMVILAALDALKAIGRRPTDNVKIVFDGEEEAGSPHMQSLLNANKALLESNLWVICDGPTHTSGRNIVIYGVRGDVNVDLTVYGPNHPLHSGHYGNWAPNPALRLARLLSSMKDDSGRVTIEGWYDDMVPLGSKEREAVSATASFDEETRKKLGFARPETAQSLDAAVPQPSLNINGMAAANVGSKASNVIPDIAQAVLDLRLVAGEEPRRQFEKLVAHVKKQGYLVLERAPTDQERLARVYWTFWRGRGVNP